MSTELKDVSSKLSHQVLSNRKENPILPSKPKTDNEIFVKFPALHSLSLIYCSAMTLGLLDYFL